MRVTKRQLRRAIREEQQRVDENILKTFNDMMGNVNKAIDQKREDLIGPYVDKLRNWLDANADDIPFYLSTKQADERAEKLKAKFEETMKKADEAREEWKKENPDKEPPWEKSFLGISASDWLPGLFPDPGREVREKLYAGKNLKITKGQLRRIIREAISPSGGMMESFIASQRNREVVQRAAAADEGLRWFREGPVGKMARRSWVTSVRLSPDNDQIPDPDYEIMYRVTIRTDGMDKRQVDVVLDAETAKFRGASEVDRY